MKIRRVIGALLFIPSMFGFHLIGISGSILHLFTAYVAFTLGGFLVGGATFAFPILGEIGVWIYAWNKSGSFVNGYSIWVLMWLGFLVLMLALMGLGGWLARSDDD